MNKTLQQQVGENVRRLRREKELTQQQLGYLTQTNSTYIVRLEHGRSNPSLLKLESIANALGTEVWKLCLPEKEE